MVTTQDYYSKTLIAHEMKHMKLKLTMPIKILAAIKKRLTLIIIQQVKIL